MSDNMATKAPKNVIYDEIVIKKIVAGAMEGVEGILGPSEGTLGGMTRSLKHKEDVPLMKAVHLKLKEERVNVTIKLIAEMGKNIPEIVEEVTSKAYAALESETGLIVESVEVEVTDVMTGAEYEGLFRTEKGKEQPAKE